MSEEPTTVAEPDVPTGDGTGAPASDHESGEGHFAWWHRSHPTFAALTGFYAGLLFIIVVPGIAGAILAWVFGPEKAEDYFPWVLVTLAVPLALLVPRKTRRFAEFVWLGIVSTVVVVVGVATLVLWVMIKHS
ncbi:hypothetical protein AB3X52_02240 [Nocardioides sp. DS6]|uniref:Uncharacterized protein n=1 Tax=Nocardioides eburneus TaxID=3231482 RepID=A0ABV3SWK1_9ACTN